MDVIPVTELKAVTKPFSPRDNQRGLSVLALVIVFQIIALHMSGCQTPTSVPSVLGHQTDVTEDLHHRIQAGVFEVGKEPLVCLVEKASIENEKRRLLFQSRKSPRELVRFSWERGSFWVQADDHALVVIYMDQEAIFSHVQIATSDKFSLVRSFGEKIEHPIR